MNREHELWAKLRSLVQSNQRLVVQHLYQMVCTLHPNWPQVSEEELLTSTRVSSLRFAANPTRERQTPSQQLEHLKRELERMQKQAKDAEKSEHVQFYTKLQEMLWTNPEENPPALWVKSIERLDLDEDEQEQWHSMIALMLSIAVLDTFAALYTTQPLQQELDTKLQKEGEGGYHLCL